jgi:hypothetical protein
MRCMACGAEMILINVVQDDAIPVPGFERQTFRCSECQDVEQRLVFAKKDRDGNTGPMPEQRAPPIVSVSSTTQDEHIAAPGVLSGPLEPAQTPPAMPLETIVPAEAIQETQTASAEPTIENHLLLYFQGNELGEGSRRETPQFHEPGSSSMRHGRENDTKPVPVHAPPLTALASTAPALFGQVVSKIIERRSTFTREKTPAQTPMKPTRSVPPEMIPAVTLELTQTTPVETTMPAQVAQTTPVETSNPGLPTALLQTNAWARAFDDKLRHLKTRAMALREAVVSIPRQSRGL